MRKGRTLTITDDLGNIDGFVLKDEVCLLLPFAEELLGPMLGKELISNKISSKIRVKKNRSKVLREEGIKEP